MTSPGMRSNCNPPEPAALAVVAVVVIVAVALWQQLQRWGVVP